MTRHRIARAAAIAALLGLARPLLADDSIPCAENLSPAESAEPAVVEPSAGPAAKPAATIVRAIVDEAKRYVGDAGALVTNPIHWDSGDLKMAAGFGAALTGLLLADHDIYDAVQRNKSRFTDRVSGATSALGQQYAWYASGAMLAGGLALDKPGLRDTGREALEALAIAGLITNIIKPIAGRERPYQSDGETVFHGLNQHFQSFPSGHATSAFAVASVVALRSDGWIIPSLAYAAAFTVAMDRINDRAHFASDVFTGAAIGWTTGRFIVHRHRRTEETERGPKVDLVPIRDGLSARVSF